MKRNILVRAALAVLLAATMPAAMAQEAVQILTAPTVAKLRQVDSDPGAGGDPFRLPDVVGKVTKLIPGNYVPGASRSWIVIGDKRWSLCVATKANTIACSPLIASPMMDGIYVSYSVVNGDYVLQLRADPASTRPVKGMVKSQLMFLRRLAKVSAMLDRELALHQSDLPMMSLLPSNGGGGGCVYLDEGGMSCAGGSAGNNHDGGGNGPYTGGGNNDPLPTGGAGNDYPSGGGNDYPSGNDNGDPPPGTGPRGDDDPSNEPWGGTNGDGAPADPNKPAPSGLPGSGCSPVPGGISCVIIKGTRPDPFKLPPIGTPPNQPPGGTWTPPPAPPTPKWSWADLCATYQMFCGWEPIRFGDQDDTDPDEGLTPHEKKLKACTIASVKGSAWCQAKKAMGGTEEAYQQCLTENSAAHLACIRAAGNGK